MPICPLLALSRPGGVPPGHRRLQILTVSQSLPDFPTPFIVDESFDSSVYTGEHFPQLQDGFEAAPGPLLSMSGYGKLAQPGLINFQPQPMPIPNQAFYEAFAEPHLDHHPLLHPENGGPESDFQYVSANEYHLAKGFADVKPAPVEFVHGNDVAARSFSAPQHGPASTQNNFRKRKASSVDGFDFFQVQKKPNMAQVQVQDPNGDYYDLSGQTSPYSPFVPTPTGSTGFPACGPLGASPRPSGHHYSTSTASQVSLAAPSPHTPVFSPSFATVKSEQSPGAPSTPIPRHASANSPLKSSIPKLVRTSTIQQSPPGVYANTVMSTTQNFNPYAMHPLKANLKLKGDLESMKEGWTADEKEARRRLVEFKRTQTNSTITAEFGGVAPQDRQPSSICISCIWWKERNEFYVTSVDTIYLLEALVGVRFTVEEKNRIRRNLEGFRPMTISKAKPDSEEFFKVIMGFPHPKPRNIEKDVKVFPWKILSTALKKIISKYSASYSSTAASLLTPTPSVFSNGEGLSECSYPASPHPAYLNAGCLPPAVGPDGSYGPALDHMRAAAPVAPAPPPELQLQMPEYMPPFDGTAHYPYPAGTQLPPATMTLPSHPMTAPVTRVPSWEYASFVGQGPVSTLPPQSAPHSAYPRAMGETMVYLPTAPYLPN